MNRQATVRNDGCVLSYFLGKLTCYEKAKNKAEKGKRNR